MRKPREHSLSIEFQHCWSVVRWIPIGKSIVNVLLYHPRRRCMSPRPPLQCPQRAMARGKRTRPEDKGAVLALHDYGLSTAEVSKRTGIHVRTVRRIVSRGGAGAEECKRDGGPKRRRRSGLLSHAGVEETIRAALKWDCTLYQDELADVVSDLCDVVCTRHAIGRALRALGIKRKQVRAPPPNLCDYADSVATSRFPCARANATRSCGWTFAC